MMTKGHVEQNALFKLGHSSFDTPDLFVLVVFDLYSVLAMYSSLTLIVVLLIKWCCGRSVACVC